MTSVKDKFLYVGLFFLVFGIFVSVSVLSLFHILSAIPLLVYFIQNFKGYKFPKSAIFLGLFLVWGFFSNLMNLNDLNDVTRSFGKLKYIIFSLLSLVSFPFFFKNYMTQKRTSFLIKTFFFTIIAACVIGVIKSRFGFDLITFKELEPTGRSEGLTGIMRYGYGTGFVLSILFGAILYKSKIENMISFKWLILAFVFGLIGLIETGCRGAILGTFCSIPFIIFFKNKKWGKASFVLVATIVTTVIAIMSFGGSSSSRIFQKITSASNLIRLSQYHSSAIATLENPVFGVGVNQFSSECKDIKSRHGIYFPNYCEKLNLKCDDYSSYKPFYSHAHNIFLETSANTGFIGLIFFTFWLIFWLIEMFKRKDLLGYIIIPFIINLLIAGQFEYVFDANNSFLIFLVYPLSFLKKKHLNFSLD